MSACPHSLINPNFVQNWSPLAQPQLRRRLARLSARTSFSDPSGAKSGCVLGLEAIKLEPGSSCHSTITTARRSFWAGQWATPHRHPEAVVGEVSTQFLVGRRKVGRPKAYEPLEAAGIERLDQCLHLCRLCAAVRPEVRYTQTRRIAPPEAGASPLVPSRLHRFTRQEANDLVSRGGCLRVGSRA
jgi:hypothetical protein